MLHISPRPICGPKRNTENRESTLLDRWAIIAFRCSRTASFGSLLRRYVPENSSCGGWMSVGPSRRDAFRTIHYQLSIFRAENRYPAGDVACNWKTLRPFSPRFANEPLLDNLNNRLRRSAPFRRDCALIAIVTLADSRCISIRLRF